MQRFYSSNFVVFNAKLILIFLALMVGITCTQQTDSCRLLDLTNPEYRPNTEFELFEDLKSPKFAHLIKKYQLDTVVREETNEFQRILILRDWMKSVIRIENDSRHYSGDGYAEGILDAALEGEGFHCSHFMRVQNAVLNAYGYLTRVINAGPGVEEKVPDDNHGIDEVWSNDYGKWFLSDAKYNHHFEKDGIPLSTLEIRDEYLKNKAADIVMVKGVGRTPTEFDEEFGRSKESFAQTYTWPRWYMVGNRHTIYPERYNSPLLVFEDDFFNRSKYYREGELVDHKNIDYWHKVTDRNAIEWTPNVVKVDARIEQDSLYVGLISDTPNFKEYQMKENDTGEWKKVISPLELKLGSDNQVVYYFRSVNLANVFGPVSRVSVEKN